jgi:NADPH:quinone reductase-like Zn-dependent oxidoreductase
MLTRTDLKEDETVLITGASGGVGSAAVQLAKRRNAKIIAVTGSEKADAVRSLGADQIIPRGASFEDELGSNNIDVVIDLVAGAQWPQLLKILRRGGRYAVSGAIAGPIVELDVRTLYLKDLNLFGCTLLESEVFPNLIRYIQRGEIQPVVAARYPLDQIVTAQKVFLSKKFVGKIVLDIPG